MITEDMTLAEVKNLITDIGYLWRDRALCLDQEPSIFVSEEHRFNPTKAISICKQCEVRAECLAYSIHAKCTAGVFGGLTSEDRKGLQNRLKVREIFKRKDLKK